MNAASLINQTAGPDSCEWFTPAAIVEAARLTMGGIDLDPASSAKANLIVQAEQFYTIYDDGLKHQWFGNVWMNHPFSRKGNRLWIAKLLEEVTSRRTRHACCITYACTSEKWFQPLLKQPQCYLYPRTNYLLPDGSVKRGVTKGSVVTYFGPNEDRFAIEFEALGTIKR